MATGKTYQSKGEGSFISPSSGNQDVQKVSDVIKCPKNGSTVWRSRNGGQDEKISKVTREIGNEETQRGKRGMPFIISVKIPEE